MSGASPRAAYFWILMYVLILISAIHHGSPFLSSSPSLSNFVRNLITKFSRHRVGLIYRKQFRWNFISFWPGLSYLSGLASPAIVRDSFTESYEAILQQWLAKLKKLGNVENFKCIISDHFTFLRGDDLGSRSKKQLFKTAAQLKGFCSRGTLSLIKTCKEQKSWPRPSCPSHLG